MAEKGLKAFEEALKADESLRAKFEETLKGVAEVASDGEAIQKAAAELGYDLSLEELEQAWAASQELDEAELDAVAGGQDLYEDNCVFIWCCYIVSKHPGDIPDVNENCGASYRSTTNHTESCFSDFWCMWVNNQYCAQPSINAYSPK